MAPRSRPATPTSATWCACRGAANTCLPPRAGTSRSSQKPKWCLPRSRGWSHAHAHPHELLAARRGDVHDAAVLLPLDPLRCAEVIRHRSAECAPEMVLALGPVEAAAG